MGLLPFLECLTSCNTHSVFQGPTFSEDFTCCHTEMGVAGQTCCFTQSQCTDTGLTRSSVDPVTPGAWQDSHNGEVTCTTTEKTTG